MIKGASLERPGTPNEAAITRACAEIRDLLLAKAQAYGDSVFNPLQIFSTATPLEQLATSIDHKLSRVKHATVDSEDTIIDLIGYLVLYWLAMGG